MTDNSTIISIIIGILATIGLFKVSSLNNSAIIGWFTKKDLMSFEKYNHEQRQAPTENLICARPMLQLLNFIK